MRNKENEKHDWIWDSDEPDSDLYCFKCHMVRNFNISEEEEAPCKGYKKSKNTSQIMQS